LCFIWWCMLNKRNFSHNLAVTLLIAAVCPEISIEGGTVQSFIYIHTHVCTCVCFTYIYIKKLVLMYLPSCRELIPLFTFWTGHKSSYLITFCTELNPLLFHSWFVNTLKINLIILVIINNQHTKYIIPKLQ
jgi:hypothetical protein